MAHRWKCFCLPASAINLRAGAHRAGAPIDQDHVAPAWPPWQRGDLAVRDNRALLHTARPFDHTHHERLIYRTTIIADAPLLAI